MSASKLTVTNLRPVGLPLPGDWPRATLRPFSGYDSAVGYLDSSQSAPGGALIDGVRLVCRRFHDRGAYNDLMPADAPTRCEAVEKKGALLQIAEQPRAG